MFEMTYNQALKIQQEQIEHYSRSGALTPAMVTKLHEMTKPCPFDPDEMVKISLINELVPRGGSIECLAGISQKFYD